MRSGYPNLLLCLMLILTAVHAPLATAASARFASGNSALGIPFELVNWRIYVKASIDRSKPLTFLVDNELPTGINKDLTKTLTLDASMRPGAAGMPKDMVRNAMFGLQGVQFLDSYLPLLPLSGNKEIQTDGVLGRSFFSTFVVEIDYKNHLLNVYKPESYHYEGHGEVIPTKVESDNSVSLEAMIQPAEGPAARGALVIDAGDEQELVLYEPFIEHNKFPKGASEGIKSAVPLQQIQIGKLSIERPSAVMFTNSKQEPPKGVAGVIGAGILSNYRVVLDEPHHRLILESPK